MLKNDNSFNANKVLKNLLCMQQTGMKPDNNLGGFEVLSNWCFPIDYGRIFYVF